MEPTFDPVQAAVDSQSLMVAMSRLKQHYERLTIQLSETEATIVANNQNHLKILQNSRNATLTATTNVSELTSKNKLLTEKLQMFESVTIPHHQQEKVRMQDLILLLQQQRDEALRKATLRIPIASSAPSPGSSNTASNAIVQVVQNRVTEVKDEMENLRSLVEKCRQQHQRVMFKKNETTERYTKVIALLDAEKKLVTSLRTTHNQDAKEKEQLLRDKMVAVKNLLQEQEHVTTLQEQVTTLTQQLNKIKVFTTNLQNASEGIGNQNIQARTTIAQLQQAMTSAIQQSNEANEEATNATLKMNALQQELIDSNQNVQRKVQEKENEYEKKLDALSITFNLEKTQYEAQCEAKMNEMSNKFDALVDVSTQTDPPPVVDIAAVAVVAKVAAVVAAPPPPPPQPPVSAVVASAPPAIQVNVVAPVLPLMPPPPPPGEFAIDFTPQKAPPPSQNNVENLLSEKQSCQSADNYCVVCKEVEYGNMLQCSSCLKIGTTSSFMHPSCANLHQNHGIQSSGSTLLQTSAKLCASVAMDSSTFTPTCPVCTK